MTRMAFVTLMAIIICSINTIPIALSGVQCIGGHARSKDLVHWESLPIALTPGDPEDKDGCFSGTAIEKDGVLYLFYTGHHYYGDNDPDHFWQNQNMAYSTDGINFTKYEKNPIIAKAPEDNTHHFRDPKVWKHEDTYYMLLGSQGDDELGRGIIYTSSDLLEWEYQGPMSKSDGILTEGYMWECPDFFELDGKFVFLLSPQGIEKGEKKHLNLFQNGYFVGDFDYDNTTFTRGKFTELDKGHDFYAPQTTLTPDGRRILIGWMSMWESYMPEKVDGWAGTLTVPRELSLKDGYLYMKPAKELEQLRVGEGINTSTKLTGNLTLSEESSYAEALIDVDLSNTNDQVIKWTLEANGESLIDLTYDQKENEWTLVRSDRKDDPRYATIKECDQVNIHVFIDKSSAEIFINDGEIVFTERYYTEDTPNMVLNLEKEAPVSSTVYQLEDHAVTYD